MKKLTFRGFSAKSNIGQGKSNNKKGEQNQSQNVCIPESCEVQIHKIPPLSLYAKYKEIIAATISNVKTTNLNEGSIPGNMGDTIATPNQNTERLINQSANTDWTIFSLPLIVTTIAKKQFTFNGQIDNVTVYNYTPTATQIKTLYNSGAVRFAPSTGSP